MKTNNILSIDILFSIEKINHKDIKVIFVIPYNC